MKIVFWSLLAIAFLFLFYLFLLTPRRRRTEAARLMQTPYAHRGLWGKDAPENSLAAFRRAVEKGVGIELDVQLSSDGEVMVFHDENLFRMTGVDASLYEKDESFLKKTALKGSDEKIPSFKEVLALVDGKVPLLVEIKSDHAWKTVCEKTAALLDGYKGEYVIESFHPLAVAWFRKNRKAVVRGQLSARLWKEKKRRTLAYFIVQNLILNFYARPDFIAYDVKDKGALAFRLVKLFRPYTLAWTVKNAKDLKDARSFDGVIFEEGALSALSYTSKTNKETGKNK